MPRNRVLVGHAIHTPSSQCDARPKGGANRRNLSLLDTPRLKLSPRPFQGIRDSICEEEPIVGNDRRHWSRTGIVGIRAEKCCGERIQQKGVDRLSKHADDLLQPGERIRKHRKLIGAGARHGGREGDRLAEFFESAACRIRNDVDTIQRPLRIERGPDLGLIHALEFRDALSYVRNGVTR